MKKFTLVLLLIWSTLSVFGQVSLFDYNTAWKYKDDGSDQGTTWTSTTFDDSGWSSGNGQFGYGDGDETTILNACGTVTQYPSCSNKYITSFYRKTFTISNVNDYTSFTFSVLRDDGAIVYVNGTEVWRNNMPTGTVTYTTTASTACSDDGATAQTFTLTTAAAGLVSGSNTIAVEIHQNAGSSSDLTFDMKLSATTPASGGANLARGPYIQTLTDTSVIIHWKTDIAIDSKIQLGTDTSNYTQIITDPTITDDHIMQLTGLIPATKYYYTIGTATGVIQGDTNNYFITAPVSGTTGKYTFWVSGDCGTNTTHHRNVRDRFVEYMNGQPTNGWLLLGDNAYNSGTESEYTSTFFDIYTDDVMKNTALWPVPGNHDYANSAARQADHAVPYYDIFDLPVNAEAGGVPSGNEAYYSFDYGNIHFLALDSYGKEDNASTRLYDTLGAQVQWVKADLAANTKPWVIAYWHHAPYTMGSHNSDNESELVQIRENFIQILEREGVDLILSGHSHNYERSKLMHGHYGNEASFDSTLYNLSQSSGKYDGTENSCTYLKDSTHNSLEGTVYVVSGSSGKISGTQAGYPHDALPYANATDGGSLILEFDDNRLDVKWLCADGVTRDNFTIIKNSSKRDSITINYGDSLTLTASWKGDYSWASDGDTNRTVQVSPEVSGYEVVYDQYQCIADSFYIEVIQPELTAATPATLGYCTGASLELPYSVNGYYNSDNAFNLELSNLNGSFDNATILGSITGTQADTFQVIIPETLASGNYLMRVNAVHPSIQSNTIPISIHPVPAVSFTGLNASYYDDNASVTLTGTPGGGTFSGQGISNNQFDPSTAGIGGPYTIIYQYTTEYGCTSADTLLTTVNAGQTNGIEELLSGMTFKVYPNPANDILHIQLDSETSGVISFMMNDVLGHEVISQQTMQLNSGSSVLDINLSEYQLSNGVYYLELVKDGDFRVIKVSLN